MGAEAERRLLLLTHQGATLLLTSTAAGFGIIHNLLQLAAGFVYFQWFANMRKSKPVNSKLFRIGSVLYLRLHYKLRPMIVFVYIVSKTKRMSDNGVQSIMHIVTLAL